MRRDAQATRHKQQCNAFVDPLHTDELDPRDWSLVLRKPRRFVLPSRRTVSLC